MQECMICLEDTNSPIRACVRCKVYICENCYPNFIDKYDSCSICTINYYTDDFPIIEEHSPHYIKIHNKLEYLYMKYTSNRFYTIIVTTRDNQRYRFQNYFYQRGNLIYDMYKFPFQLIEYFEIEDCSHEVITVSSYGNVFTHNKVIFPYGKYTIMLEGGNIKYTDKSFDLEENYDYINNGLEYKTCGCKCTVL